MIYRIACTYPDSLMMLPEEVLERLPEAGDREIRILLHLASLLGHGAIEEDDLVDTLSSHFDPQEVRLAIAFWRGCGILDTDLPEVMPRGERKKTKSTEKKAPKKVIDAEEAPFYSAKDLAEAAENVPDFKNLVSFAEGRLEKVMNTSELARLYSFLDYLKMPLDVVMLVIEDCVSREKKSLRYITKMLTSFQDDGIDTYEKAEAYFASRQEKMQYERIVRRLFGLGERKLTSAEDEILSTWRNKFCYGEEMLNAAYEKTVASAKNPSIKYMHKILEGWFKDGIQSPDQIGKSSPGGEKAAKSYDLDDFFQQAVSKGRKKL